MTLPDSGGTSTNIEDAAGNQRMKMKQSRSRRRKKPALVAAAPAAVLTLEASFPIVGIGASAGGLEALEQFLRHVPAGSGMAFIIVQHLAPTRKGILAELLQRVTGMKVVQVKDRTSGNAHGVPSL